MAAIIASVGGDHSCHLLPHLDFELIAQNPKIFMGYSDVTVLNVAIWQRTGLVTFNGPAIMTDFAEYPTPLDYTIRQFEHAVCSGEAIGRIRPAAEWTEEFLDWRTRTDLTRRAPSKQALSVSCGGRSGSRVSGVHDAIDTLFLTTPTSSSESPETSPDRHSSSRRGLRPLASRR